MELLSDYERKILNLIANGKTTLTEISREIGLSKPATSKYLKKLEEQGIMKGSYERSKEGRIVRYRLQGFHVLFSINPEEGTIIYIRANEPFDRNFPFLGFIPQKNFRREVREYLSEVVKANFDRWMIILYGSVAKGSAHRKSDIDLLFLKEGWSKEERERVLRLLAGVSERCGHRVDPSFVTSEEFNQMNESLKKEIKEWGIILYEKGEGWNRIKREMKRYRNITI